MHTAHTFHGYARAMSSHHSGPNMSDVASATDQPAESGNGAATIVPLAPQDDQALKDVLQLHREAKRTLGPMPTEGFTERAAAGTLLVATKDSSIVGYVLFDLPAQRIAVRHLCVSQSMRGQGIGRALIEAIRDDHGHRIGIHVRCRRNFEDARP